ncbi:hypothetical protein CLHUN_28560 [Ruminiclostridium hungatei]|uniref:Uncharacterized protein n=1 Tax=Ruminiclostridium hungatei TaxID=48256 RepID=A0A1V4SHG0_RUMHU|nr:hypothetical protein [Ruminiclostridium hungatei]OPX43308.1 hypothetical protein CLHUN_28560 [Ruminiclostridium hungatei]
MEVLKKYFWLICLTIGVGGFLITWFCLPHQGAIEKIWWLVFKLAIYGFIILSIAFFPNKQKYGFLLVILPFFVFLGYIIPRISYFGFSGIVPVKYDEVGGEFYTLLYLLLYPMINFTTAFAYRMGGGKPGHVIKISVTGVLIIFSGFLDLMWYVINSSELPDVLQYSHHIIIFFGRIPTYTEGIIFALCHIPFIIAVLLLPLDKWIEKISNKFTNNNSLNHGI